MTDLTTLALAEGIAVTIAAGAWLRQRSRTRHLQQHLGDLIVQVRDLAGQLEHQEPPGQQLRPVLRAVQGGRR